MKSTRERLQEVYDRLPDVACQGHCWNACGPIPMSEAERQRIADRGVVIPPATDRWIERWEANEPVYCPAFSLGAQGEGKPGCTVYEDRPMICRAFGVGEGALACSYGCPTTGEATYEEVADLMLKTLAISNQITDSDIRRIRSEMNDPEIQEMVRSIMGGKKCLLRNEYPCASSARRRSSASRSTRRLVATRTVAASCSTACASWPSVSAARKPARAASTWSDCCFGR